MISSIEALLEGDASRFLMALAGSGRITFQCFDDTGNKRPALSKILHGSLNQHESRLRQLNEQGAGVFVMVNQGDCRGRRKDNVTGVRALFVDLDGAPLEPVLLAPIAPHIVVESSPGRFHAYWLLNDGFPLEDFKPFQVHLARFFNADPSVNDLPRVMRLPGFNHCKNGVHPTKILSIQDGQKLSREQFIDAFEINADIRKGQRNTALFNAAQSSKRHGIAKVAARAKIEKINAVKCDEPLDAEEVARIVESAYSYRVDTFALLPHEMIDSDEYERLSSLAVKLLTYALRRHRPGSSFALPHTEFSHIPGMKNRRQFRDALKELLDAGFIQMVRNYVSSVIAESRICALYMLTDRVQVVPKKKEV